MPCLARAKAPTIVLRASAGGRGPTTTRPARAAATRNTARPLAEARPRAPPALASRKPREGTAGHELPGRLGDHVIVSRGAAAGKRGEVLLMPPDLLQGKRVVVEQEPYPGPVVKETPDPYQADQANAELDPAGPVHAGQEG